jgi:hypothetical protein
MKTIQEKDLFEEGLERLRVASRVAPVLRGHRRAKRVFIIDDAGQVKRVVSTDELQKSLLKRAKIEIDTEDAEVRECLKCGKPFVATRTVRGKVRRRYCNKCVRHRGPPCVRCGEPTTAPEKSTRRGERQKACAACVREMKDARAICPICAKEFAPYSARRGAVKTYCGRVCATASLRKGDAAATKKERAAARYKARIANEAERAILLARQRERYRNLPHAEKERKKAQARAAHERRKAKKENHP